MAQRTKLRIILPKIRERLAAKTEKLSADIIHFQWRNRNALPRFLGQQDAVVSVGAEKRLDQTRDAGRIDLRCQRSVYVLARTQNLIDPASEKDSWLADETFGHLELEDQIIDALENFIPMEGRRSLTVDGFKYEDATEPASLPSFGDGWGGTWLRFSFIYRRSVKGATLTKQVV